MQVRPQRLLMVWALVCFAAAAAAQRPVSAAQPGSAPFVVQGLGRATLPLDGIWQFHAGDDAAWASPSCDDSGWAPIEVGKTWEEQGHRRVARSRSSAM